MDSLRSAVKRRRLRSIGLRLAFLCAFLLVAGFGLFIWLLPEQEVPLDRNADGIVVLTGGTSRVMDALELLSHGHGKRLLITGVDPDYAALNTLGNAVQTRHWALAHNFNSLIIVTSAYHMPRAMAEIAHQLP